jgi:hypothetical protein
MMMKVRRRRLAAVAFLGGATLVQTSMSLVSGSWADDQNLNLRVLSSISSLPAPEVWAIPMHRRPGSAAGLVRALKASSGQVSERVLGATVKLGTGRPDGFLTNAATVGGLLGAMKVRLGTDDAVRPPRRVPLTPGIRVRVIRIRHSAEAVTVDLGFSTLIQYSRTVAAGVTEVVKAGVPGKVVRTYEVTYRNGVEVDRRLLGEVQLSLPQQQVEIHGTGPVTGGSQCGIASWYAGRTGGYVAAHRTLPFGTSVRVTDLDNGRTVTVVINDRGPYITGRIIDLSDDAFSILASLGQGTARVCISW